MGCGILVPWLGLEPLTPGGEAGDHNHGTSREIPLLWSLLWGFIVSLGRALIHLSFHPFIHSASVFWDLETWNLRNGPISDHPCRFLLTILLSHQIHLCLHCSPKPHRLSQAYCPASSPIIPPRPGPSSMRVRGSGSRASVCVFSLVLPQTACEPTGRLVKLSVPQLPHLRKSPSDNTGDSTWPLHPPPLIPVAPNHSQFQAGALCWVILLWFYICLRLSF